MDGMADDDSVVDTVGNEGLDLALLDFSGLSGDIVSILNRERER